MLAALHVIFTSRGAINNPTWLELPNQANWKLVSDVKINVGRLTPSLLSLQNSICPGSKSHHALVVPRDRSLRSICEIITIGSAETALMLLRWEVSSPPLPDSSRKMVPPVDGSGMVPSTSPLHRCSLGCVFLVMNVKIGYVWAWACGSGRNA